MDATNPKLTARTQSIPNIEGCYFVAIDFACEQNHTREGVHTIRICASNYSTLNQHLQDVYSIAAHDTIRARIKPKLPPIFYSNEPEPPARLLTAMLRVLGVA